MGENNCKTPRDEVIMQMEQFQKRVEQKGIHCSCELVEKAEEPRILFTADLDEGERTYDLPLSTFF